MSEYRLILVHKQFPQFVSTDLTGIGDYCIHYETIVVLKHDMKINQPGLIAYNFLVSNDYHITRSSWTGSVFNSLSEWE